MSGPLPNARHERFAQELAKGVPAVHAYTSAGYRPSTSAPARLCDNVRIASRVEELKHRAAARTEITVASITEALVRIAKKGEDFAEPAGLSVARAALMDAAKLNGLVVESVETIKRTPIDRSRRLAELKAELSVVRGSDAVTRVH